MTALLGERTMGGKVVPNRAAGCFLIFLSLVVALAVAPLTASAGLPASAGSPEKAIEYLNQQRAAYGIPPVTLDQSLLKQNCSLANHEIAAGFSPSEFPWERYLNPWNTAPWHEQIFFDPGAVTAAYGTYAHFGEEGVVTGGEHGSHWVCMWFGHDWSYSGPPRFYWAADASGPKAVPASLGAYEWPSTPAQDLGLHNPTGPNISVYASGADAPGAVAATVTDPSGQIVPTHLTAQYTERNAAMLVVDHPLLEGTSYGVTVTWRGNFGGSNPTKVADQVQSFSFTTAKEIRSQLKLLKGGPAGERTRVWVMSNEALRGKKADIGIAVARRRCGKELRRPRPECLWITTRRWTKSIVLSETKIPVVVPSPTPGRSIHVGIAVKRFRSDEGFVKGAGASLQLR